MSGPDAAVYRRWSARAQARQEAKLKMILDAFDRMCYQDHPPPMHRPIGWFGIRPSAQVKLCVGIGIVIDVITWEGGCRGRATCLVFRKGGIGTWSYCFRALEGILVEAIAPASESPRSAERPG